MHQRDHLLQSQSDVDIVSKSLNKYGYNAAPIHGDLDQSYRTRTLDKFRDGELRFLVASDVAARGLDIPNVSHVFNFDVPSHAEDYVHRIGRTGRAGCKGTAVMICIPRDNKYFEAVEMLVDQAIPRMGNPMKSASLQRRPRRGQASQRHPQPSQERRRACGRGRQARCRNDRASAKAGRQAKARRQAQAGTRAWART